VRLSSDSSVVATLVSQRNPRPVECPVCRHARLGTRWHGRHALRLRADHDPEGIQFHLPSEESLSDTSPTATVAHEP
jgi:hypothetical protein